MGYEGRRERGVFSFLEDMDTNKYINKGHRKKTATEGDDGVIRGSYLSYAIVNGLWLGHGVKACIN